MGSDRESCCGFDGAAHLIAGVKYSYPQQYYCRTRELESWQTSQRTAPRRCLGRRPPPGLALGCGGCPGAPEGAGRGGTLAKPRWCARWGSGERLRRNEVKLYDYYVPALSETTARPVGALNWTGDRKPRSPRRGFGRRCRSVSSPLRATLPGPPRPSRPRHRSTTCRRRRQRLG
jgi:hypothetical protein